MRTMLEKVSKCHTWVKDKDIMLEFYFVHLKSGTFADLKFYS